MLATRTGAARLRRALASDAATMTSVRSRGAGVRTCSSGCAGSGNAAGRAGTTGLSTMIRSSRCLRSLSTNATARPGSGQPFDVARHVLGVAAAGPRPSVNRRTIVETRIGAGLTDDKAGELRARNIRQRVAPSAAAQLDVPRPYPGGQHPDQDLIPAGLRQSRLADLHHIGGAKLLHHDGSHHRHLQLGPTGVTPACIIRRPCTTPGLVAGCRVVTPPGLAGQRMWRRPRMASLEPMGTRPCHLVKVHVDGSEARR